MIASVAAATLLSLSVGAAAQTAQPSSPLVLQQSLNGEITCVSPDATCSIVNLYGRDGDPDTSPIRPGDQLTTTVELRNGGNIAASGLGLSSGACQNHAQDGGTAIADLCATVTVAVACTSGGTTFSLGSQTLTRFGQDGSHTVTSGLAAGASATCRFTVTYPDDAPPTRQALRAVQPVTWTLMAPEAPTPPPPPSPLPAGDIPAAPAAPPRGVLAFTGGDALLLALAGVALLVVGGVLHRLSRREDRQPSQPVA